MSFSFSQPQTSSFLAPNELLDLERLRLAPQEAADVHQNRMLEAQTSQRNISAFDMEQAGRIAGSVLDETTYPTPEARAAAYPALVARARANGAILPHAPDTYPGDDAMRSIFRMAMPAKDLYTTQQNQAGWGQITGDGTGTTSTGGGGATAPATSSGTVEPDALARAQAVRDGLIKRGLDVDTATAFAANALHESGANPNVGTGDAGASHGVFQWRDDRYNRFGSTFGRPLDNAPLDQQLDYVVSELGSTEGAARDRIAAAQGPAAKAAAVSQYYLRPKDVEAEKARRSGTATQLVSQWGSAGTSTATSAIRPVITGDSLASQGGLGGAGVVGASPKAVLAGVQADSRAGKYSGQPVVLSTGASNDATDLASVEQQIREAQGGNAGRITVLGVGPAVEAKAPGTNAKLQALAKSYGADFVPLPADQMSPDGVHPTAQGYATLKAAIAPPQGAPGGVAARTGGTDVAGPGAGPGGAPGADLVGPRVLPPIGPGSPVVTPQSLANTPTPRPQPQVPQPPQNALAPTPPTPPQPAAPVVAQQQPPAPVQPAARPAAPAAGGLLAGLSPDQVQAVQALRRSNGTPAQGLAMIEHFKEVNATAAHQAVEDARQREADVRATQAAADTAEKAARERQKAADPIQGTDDKSNADRTLFRLVDKMNAGTATPEERRLYAQAAQYYLKPQMQWISDPNEPTKSIMVPVAGQLPYGFPHPSFQPGQPSTETKPPTPTKTDSKPLPDSERKLLVDTSTRLDQLAEQRSTFKPDFGGFGSAALGEAANLAARNLPASPTAVARADWWQNYQRMKLAVRQGISGQSLTASELAEFDKADINPGMSADRIAANLAHQDRVLRTSHERRVRSLAADRYSPDAIREAGGIDPTTAAEHPAGVSAPPPPASPPPPGFRVIVP